MGAKTVPRTRTVVEMEVEALHWAVVNVSRFQYKQVIFESDSQELISLMKGEESRPHIDPILLDIQQHLHNFDEVKFEFSKRESNKVVDRIAQESLSFKNYVPKLYSIVPIWLKAMVETDRCFNT